MVETGTIILTIETIEEQKTEETMTIRKNLQKLT